MKLWAISDLHLACPANREALEQLAPRPDDWLLVAGDVGETQGQTSWAMSSLAARFAKIFWVPGNHDLWTVRDPQGMLRGDAKYRRLVEICRSYGVHTPEDPYVEWPEPGAAGERYVIAPLFLLYDYSFRPNEIPAEQAVDWAAEWGLRLADEDVLHPDPFPDRSAWCADRLRYTERRLQLAAEKGLRPILVNHFPLRRDRLLRSRLQRLAIWCGTAATEDWHTRFNAAAVVYGHLHVKRTHWRDGVRFEEVSLGYPSDWDQDRGLESYLRQILPDPSPAAFLAATRRDD